MSAAVLMETEPRASLPLFWLQSGKTGDPYSLSLHRGISRHRLLLRRYVHPVNDAIRAYATLGVDYTASKEELRRAYRAQLQRYHPDTGEGDVRALQSVTSAYQTLRGQYKGSYLSSAQWPNVRPPVGKLVDLYA
jgi:DnaJ domain